MLARSDEYSLWDSDSDDSEDEICAREVLATTVVLAWVVIPMDVVTEGEMVAL